MPAKKKTTKKAPVKRKSVTRKAKPVSGVTPRTWALFVLFLLVSAFAFYRINAVGY
jgi:hypothetical protein